MFAEQSLVSGGVAWCKESIVMCFLVLHVLITEQHELLNSTQPVHHIQNIYKNKHYNYNVSGFLPVSVHKHSSSQASLSPDLEDVSGPASSDELLASLQGSSAAAGEPMTRSSLEWMMNVYNPHQWGESPPGKLSDTCRQHLQVYLQSLDNETTWAAQMTDASGRYSSQFFFGNDFWLGSHDLCDELQNGALQPVNLPFSVAFHVARLRVHLTETLTPHSRTVFLGLCLPGACSQQDISNLLQAASPRSTAGNSSRSLEVVRVRPVPGDYSILIDPKFHILACVSAVVLVLMAAGTSYELLLESREAEDRRCSAATGRNNNELSRHGEKGVAREAERTPGLLQRIITSFSVVSNGRKILNCNTPEDSLTSVHGLRFLSLAWVVMVHTYLQVFAIAENKTFRTLTERNFMFQTISNATFSVDTFFFISGLLVAFLYFRNVAKSSANSDGSFKTNSLKFLMLVLYRFIRLTPAYLFVLGLVELSMRWIHNNSVFEPKILDQLNCDNYWWRNALYINSLFPRADMCMLWSWYMANDTQFYILGILLLLLAVRYFRLVAASWGVFLVSSWCTTAFISFHNNYQAKIQEPFALFDELYDKPWTRVGPYLIGMATGWLLFKTNCSIKIPRVVVVIGWTLSLLCLLSLVYGLIHSQLDVVTSAAYVAFGHTAWGISLAWIVIACCTGYGGMVNTLLSFRALYPLSRLTYCAYLVHPMIMVLTSFQMDGPLHLHNGLVLVLYLGNVVAAFLLSFIISLAFEAPVVCLLKIALGGDKKTA